MSIPITLGSLKTDINDMQIGDYIAARFTAENKYTPGQYSEMGTVNIEGLEELSDYLGEKKSDTDPIDGYVYCMKIDKGILIPNNYLYLEEGAFTISYGSLTYYNKINDKNYIYGNKVNIDNKTFLIRVLNRREVSIIWSDLNGMVNSNNFVKNFGIEMYSGQNYMIIQDTLYGGYTWNVNTHDRYTHGSPTVKCALIYNESGKPDDQVNLY